MQLFVALRQPKKITDCYS